MATRIYRILDVGLILSSPQAAFLEAFHQDYGRFQVDALPEGRVLAVHFEGNPGAFLEVDGVRRSLEGLPRPEAYAAQALARILMDRVEAFTVLHAAVVAGPRGALALTGPSGAGKTTLTLALLEAGWGYYSDDFCPLHRVTGRVHPFPRSLWVRPAPGEEATFVRRGKVLHPLDGTAFSIGGPPLPLAALICLDGGGADPLVRVRLSLREGREGPLLEALRGVEGVELRAEGGRDWILRYGREGGCGRRVQELLRGHREALWIAFPEAERHPDFTAEPVLEPLPAHGAAFFLLQELKQDLLEDRRPGALLGHLTSLLAGVPCFRLTPGPIDRCLARIQAALAPVECS